MTYQFLSGFHIVSAISALIFGLCVLLTSKGTRLHKQFGYAYFFNMLGLNSTSRRCSFTGSPVISDRSMGQPLPACSH